jgi:hypothetical protein
MITVVGRATAQEPLEDTAVGAGHPHEYALLQIAWLLIHGYHQLVGRIADQEAVRRPHLDAVHEAPSPIIETSVTVHTRKRTALEGSHLVEM